MLLTKDEVFQKALRTDVTSASVWRHNVINKLFSPMFPRLRAAKRLPNTGITVRDNMEPN